MSGGRARVGASRSSNVFRSALGPAETGRRWAGALAGAGGCRAWGRSSRRVGEVLARVAAGVGLPAGAVMAGPVHGAGPEAAGAEHHGSAFELVDLVGQEFRGVRRGPRFWRSVCHRPCSGWLRHAPGRASGRRGPLLPAGRGGVSERFAQFWGVRKSLIINKKQSAKFALCSEAIANEKGTTNGTG